MPGLLDPWRRSILRWVLGQCRRLRTTPWYRVDVLSPRLLQFLIILVDFFWLLLLNLILALVFSFVEPALEPRLLPWRFALVLFIHMYAVILLSLNHE